MKTIWRILMILLAITAVAGTTYALGQTQIFAQIGIAGDGPEGRRPPDGDLQPFGPGFEQGNRPEPGGRFGDRDGGGLRGGFNLSAVSEFGRTLIPIVLVITAVVLFTKIISWIQRKRRTT